MAKVTMPQLGESVAEGTIGKWLKQPGDHVAKYEPLLEVITDKVNAEVPSPFEGTLKEILVEEGATVPNNAEIAVIEEAGVAAAPAKDAPAPSKADAPKADASTADTPAPAQPTATSSASAEPTPAAAAAPDETREPETRQPAPAAGSSNAAASSPMASTAPVAASSNGPAGSDERGPQELASVGPGNADARMTPAVRRLLREHGLSAALIVGTGGGGRITREDVTDYVESQRTGQPVGKQNAAAGAAAAASASAAGPATSGAARADGTQPAPATAPAGTPAAGGPASAAARPASAPAAQASPQIAFPQGADEVLVPMTQMRKGIAAQMTRALQVPHAYVQMEVDLTALVKFRERNKKEYQAREGLPLSYVPFVVKASADALKRNPTFNAHWTDQGLLAKRRVNIGIAVAVSDGLIVPVIRDVDNLSINGLNKAIADVSERARQGRFQIDDFGGGTFTVDNTGWLGTNMVMPIINVPEVGIVTMDRITKRPVVVETEDGDVIGIRSIMNMVLGVDHRANDGAGGAALLRDIKAWLEAVGPETAIY
ncbi:MAG TPA: dihydrolipoamide acetyltransferase family protein [Candidatus Limnocylindrales bacterium]|nr:dihydrolipoamide acetyltransferase family protein [Candidatus Limnocylindrales bacterium]